MLMGYYERRDEMRRMTRLICAYIMASVGERVELDKIINMSGQPLDMEDKIDHEAIKELLKNK